MGQGPSTSRKPRSSLLLRSAVLQRTERASWGSSETVAGILEFGAIWTESQPNGSPAAPPGAVTSHMTEKSGRPAWLRIPCVGGLILHESMNLHFSNSPQMKELPLPPPGTSGRGLPGLRSEWKHLGRGGRGRAGWHLRVIYETLLERERFPDTFRPALMYVRLRSTLDVLVYFL